MLHILQFPTILKLYFKNSNPRKKTWIICYILYALILSLNQFEKFWSKKNHELYISYSKVPFDPRIKFVFLPGMS